MIIDLIDTSYINISSVHQKTFIAFRWSSIETTDNTVNDIIAAFKLQLFIYSLIAYKEVDSEEVLFMKANLDDDII